MLRRDKLEVRRNIANKSQVKTEGPMSTGEIVNRDRIEGNDCFGCGPHNPAGLDIAIRRDPDNPERLVGDFTPAAHLIGFPGIVHGGILYTALDCMAAWTPLTLRPEAKSIWILRSAEMTYHRPAAPEAPIRLYAEIESENRPGRPIQVRAEARDGEGNPLAEGLFKVVPLSPEKFRKVAGVEKMPENWARMIGVEP
jgi:acyl-coenzyme A thioesterase PaaI-like protein